MAPNIGIRWNSVKKKKEKMRSVTDYLFYSIIELFPNYMVPTYHLIFYLKEEVRNHNVKTVIRNFTE